MFNVVKENKYWYLTIVGKGESVGRVAKFAKLNSKKPALHIGFKTKVKALGCARELNKEYWELFNKSEHKAKKMGKQATAMLETICRHMEQP